MGQNHASFLSMPKIPNKILEKLALSESIYAEGFWRMLKYSSVDALDDSKYSNLTFEEKKALIFSPEKITSTTTQDDFNVFMKPLVASSLNTAKSQTQLRFYRVKTTPITQYNGTHLFALDLLVNETACMVRWDGIMCEKLDVMEAFLMEELQMLDPEAGINFLRFDRIAGGNCYSELNINDSKAIYGRSFLLALAYMDGSEGGGCNG